MPAGVDGVHREVVRLALAVADKYGFVLGGGVAWVLHGLVERPTEDIDLFADVDGTASAAVAAVRAALTGAGFEVYDTDPDQTDPDQTEEPDLAEVFDGFDLHEIFVVRDGRTLKLSLSRLDRRHSPIVMDVGPVLSVDDLVGSKIAALVSRREARDYVDAAAALAHYTVEQLLTLAHRQDPGLEPEDVRQVGRYLDRLPDSRFARYGLDAAQVAQLRSRLSVWPRD